MEAGNAIGARDRLAHLAQRWPGRAEILFRLGESELACGRIEQAIACLVASFHADRHWRGGRPCRTAQVALQAGRFSDAERILRDALEEPGSNAQRAAAPAPRDPRPGGKARRGPAAHRGTLAPCQRLPAVSGWLCSANTSHSTWIPCRWRETSNSWAAPVRPFPTTKGSGWPEPTWRSRPVGSRRPCDGWTPPRCAAVMIRTSGEPGWNGRGSRPARSGRRGDGSSQRRRLLRGRTRPLGRLDRPAKGRHQVGKDRPRTSRWRTIRATSPRSSVWRSSPSARGGKTKDAGSEIASPSSTRLKDRYMRLFRAGSARSKRRRDGTPGRRTRPGLRGPGLPDAAGSRVPGQSAVRAELDRLGPPPPPRSGSSESLAKLFAGAIGRADRASAAPADPVSDSRRSISRTTPPRPGSPVSFSTTAHPPNRQLPEMSCGGVGLLDYDGDGFLDVYLVQGGPFPPPQTEQRDRRPALPEPGRRHIRRCHRASRNRAMPGGYGHGVSVGDYRQRRPPRPVPDPMAVVRPLPQPRRRHVRRRHRAGPAWRATATGRRRRPSPTSTTTATSTSTSATTASGTPSTR